MSTRGDQPPVSADDGQPKLPNVSPAGGRLPVVPDESSANSGLPEARSFLYSRGNPISGEAAMATQTRRTFETRIDIADDTREELVQLLNARLADTFDLYSQLKQAH